MNSEPGFSSTVVIRDNEQSRTWEALLDGELVGVVVYEQASPSRLALTHAAIQEDHRMHGIGTLLISTMLEQVRQQNRTVSVWCTAVVDFLEKHPEFRGVVDRAEPGRAPIAEWERGGE